MADTWLPSEALQAGIAPVQAFRRAFNALGISQEADVQIHTKD